MKIILLSAMLILSLNCLSQIFLGLGATQKGISIEGGFQTKQKVNIAASYFRPIFTINNISNLSAGYQFSLNKEKKVLTYFLPSAGIAYYNLEDLSNYEKTGIIEERAGWRPIMHIEIGKQKYMGKAFARVTYCNTFLIGVGIKAMF